MKIKINYLIITICLIVFLVSITISLNADKFVQIKQIIKGRTCLEETQSFCYNVCGKENYDCYNECKFTNFIDRCSYEDCIDYYGCPECHYTEEVYEKEIAKCKI